MSNISDLFRHSFQNQRGCHEKVLDVQITGATTSLDLLLCISEQLSLSISAIEGINICSLE